MNKIGVIGTGIWGTALALTASRAGNDVLCWARRQEIVDSINHSHVNRTYLPDIPLPDTIKATNNIKDIFDFAKIILLTVSAQYTRETLKLIKPYVQKDTVIVICAKGIEADSGKMLSQVAREEIPDTTIAILSGPGFAIDVAERRIASVTIACEKEEIASKITDMLGTQFFRPYYTTDIISPQIGGSVKNVIAIASGIVEGAHFGDGARATLITRGFHEMSKLAKALGGELTTITGMCGLGDLVMTASCSQSRNFSFGYEIGVNGEAESVIKANTRTVEGLHTTRAVVKIAKELGIEMPICEMVNRLLFEGISLNDAMIKLLSRPYKEEGF
ncbi:MAG: NAD(P)-dependent glycerol-3-phosphate dehydrogenase [Alphaproteobacteria bacterium]|nr:NAD(P)-dependent glycerol-3-phosphate dehydrogenase [Alphaproteobacteria bacterium]